MEEKQNENNEEDINQDSILDLDIIKNSNADLISPDLWMKSARLQNLPEPNNVENWVENWKDISNSLIKYSHIQKTSPGTFMDCGELTISSNKDGETEFRNSPLLKRLLKSEEYSLDNFIIDFMKANGQLDYITDANWFKNESWKVVIKINFYPEREFNENNFNLGVHKDTKSRNLFVNLIFNNDYIMPATEWIWDYTHPSDNRLEKLAKCLQIEELQKTLNAKELIKDFKEDTLGKNKWQRGLVGAYNYVSWIDELIWHATPIVKERHAFSLQKILDYLKTFIGENVAFEEKLYIYEAMLIIAKQDNSIFKNEGTDWLNNLDIWCSSWEDLNPDNKKRVEEEINALGEEEWEQYKFTGRSGLVEDSKDNRQWIAIGNTDSPEYLRENEEDKTQEKLKRALEDMKNQDTGELPKRSFIRTWVTLVKND